MDRLLSVLAFLYLAWGYPAGTNVQIWTCNGSDRQQWSQLQSDKTIRLLVDNKCIDMANYGNSPGSNAWIWDYHGDDTQPDHQNQEWKWEGTQIILIMSNLCLDVNANYPADGTNVDIWNCTGATGQQWTYNATDKSIRSGVAPNMCLDAGSSNNCSMAPYSTYPYCNPNLDADTRVNDLVSRMNLPEKTNNMVNTNPGSPRLGLPQFPFSECLHGVMASCGTKYNGNTGCPTSFPHALALSATFNATVWKNVGTAIGEEARALHNEGNAGLAFWSPDINLFRDPRWGRGQEVPSEDPFISGEYVQHYSRGLQEGNDSRYIKVVSTAKHYADYDIEGNYGPMDRGSFNAIVNDQDQVDYYWPSFRAAVEGAHVQSIMCSYNAINGMPACADSLFMNDIARGEWQFDGFIVSDCGAITDGAFTNYIKTYYNGSQSQQAAQGVLGGCDLECGTFYPMNLYNAVQQKIISEATIDQSVKRIWKRAIQLGILDPTSIQTYTKYGPELIDTPANRKLAFDAATQAMVLLKNQNNLLPLNVSRKLALIGPHANSSTLLLSNYHGDNTLVASHTPLKAFTARVGANNIQYAQGSDFTGSNQTGFDAAVSAAKASDVALVFLGLRGENCDEAGESEGCDRKNIEFPVNQLQLLQAVVAAGKPTVVILINGGAMNLTWIKNNVPAIVEAWYPGEMGGDAIAAIVFGDVSPAGRLPTTIYDSSLTTARPSIGNMDLRAQGGITYLYYTGTPLYDFGYGLSYTTFRYDWFSSPDVEIDTQDLYKNWHGWYQGVRTVYYKVNVTNTGNRASDCVVLAFLTGSTDPDAPLRELYGYDRIHLTPGQTQTVYFSVPPQVAASTDKYGVQRLRPTKWNVEIGDSLSHLTGTLTLTGSPVVTFSLPNLRKQNQRRSQM